jgi:Pectinacetylesterase
MKCNYRFKYSRALILVSTLVSVLSTSAWAQSIARLRAANGPGGSTSGPMYRHIINSPNARCNDGTAAVAYVQAATDIAHANDWIISLEGGGSCSNAQDCLNRWQDANNKGVGIQKMSTSVSRATWNGWQGLAAAVNSPPNGWTAQTINGVPSYGAPSAITMSGILSNAAGNPFAGWNKVHLNYCSSDNHIGQNPLVLGTGIDRAGSAVAFELQFRGADIFDGLITDLRNAVACAPGPGACVSPPSLNNAGTILLTGSSAGSQGLQDTLDYFRAGQSALNAATLVRGVFDAGSGPLRNEFPYSLSLAGFTNYQAQMDHEWNNIMVGFWNARTDQSCKDLNLELPSRCADHMHLQRHHITTSFFFHTDLLDYVAGESIRKNFYPDTLSVPAGNYLPGTAAWIQSTGALDNLQDIHILQDLTARRYASEHALILADAQWMAPGIFAPRCRGHVALESAAGFNGRLLNFAGVPTNLATGIVTWLSGVPFAAYATPGTTAMPLAVCPP